MESFWLDKLDKEVWLKVDDTVLQFIVTGW